MEQQELEKLKQLEELKRRIISTILTKEAFERLGRVRSVNPELAAQVELYLVQIYQSGKLKDRITDNQMREILAALSEKKDIKIRRI